MDDEIFRQLEKFKLSNYEIKAYAYLLINGPLKATEIIKETGIPQPRMYDILGKLERRGLVLINSSIKKTYEAVMPVEAFKNEIIGMEKYINQLENYVKNNRKNKQAKSPNVWFIENDARTKSKLEEAIENATSEILLSLPDDRIRSLLPSLRKAARNKVTICSVVGNSINGGLLDSISDIGIVRTRDVTPAEIVIIDRKNSFLNAKSITETSDYSVFIQEDELVDVMDYYYFFMNWIPGWYVVDFNKYNTFKIRTSWLACEAIDNLFSNGKKIKAIIRGILRENETLIEGEIEHTERIPGVKQAFNISTKSETLSVGGKNGKLEDVRMIEGIFQVQRA